MCRPERAVLRLQGGAVPAVALNGRSAPASNCATHASNMLHIKSQACRPERNEVESNGSQPITRRRSILYCKCMLCIIARFCLWDSSTTLTLHSEWQHTSVCGRWCYARFEYVAHKISSMSPWAERSGVEWVYSDSA